MPTSVRERLTYANVVATIALFMAAGGTSYAALTITGKNVRNNSLTGRDIKNRSLGAGEFRPGQLPAGRQGPKGDRGEAGATSAVVRYGPVSAPYAGGGFGTSTAQCQAGEKALGGGAINTAQSQYVITSGPGSASDGQPATTWVAISGATTGSGFTTQAVVVCARP